MDQNRLIQDTGLVVGTKAFEFSIEEPLEAISNILKTIKQYRDFADPEDLPAWSEYIYEIFHIFGFDTKTIAPRLIALQAMGSDKKLKALVCLIGPNEDFQFVIPGLDWQSYLFYASKHYQVPWVILTNGLKFKVLNFSSDPDNQKYIQYEFDEILKFERTDSFFTIYKLFTLINLYDGKELPSSKGQIEQTGTKVYSENQLIFHEFWKTFLSRSRVKSKLFQKRSPRYSNHIYIVLGKRRLLLIIKISFKHAGIELHIDSQDQDINKIIYDKLFQDKDEIEAAIGEGLVWDRSENRRKSIVRQMIDDDGLGDKDQWPELQDKMIEAMIKFEKVFKPYIDRIEPT